jgi:YHS domain-containing protein
MSSKRMQISIAVLLVGVLIIGFAGCKGESDTDPNAAAKAGAGASATAPVTQTTQTTCPIMGKPIDKAVSTDYQGQKVYFCCAGCIDKFKAEPEKYTKDLPQFKK